VVEAFFSYKGFGALLLEASLAQDIFVIEACAMVAVFVAAGTQMLSDIGYTYLNPRIRFSCDGPRDRRYRQALVRVPPRAALLRADPRDRGRGGARGSRAVQGPGGGVRAAAGAVPAERDAAADGGARGRPRGGGRRLLARHRPSRAGYPVAADLGLAAGAVLF